MKKDLGKLTEEYDLKKNDYRVSIEVTEIFKKTVEDMNFKTSELEGRVGELMSQVSKLKAMKYDILYAAKEAVKKALKKPHYLRQAIENLDEEAANEIRAMFQELGIKINY